jgi:hypothetical protein
VLPTFAWVSSHFRTLLIAGFAALVLVKIPGVLQGRLWAEDGFFLIDAVRLPWWRALITPHTGYIDVVASGAMLIAVNLVKLEHAALISVLMALAIQLCPALLLVTSRCSWLQSPWALVTALLLVAMPPVADEIWLSPVTSQYHLMVCVGLILAFEAQGGLVGAFQLVLLILAGLSGPGPALAAPLFIVRAITDRSWPRVIHAVALSAGALIEIAFFWSHPVGERHLGISVPLLLGVIYVKHLLVPFFGDHIAASLARPLSETFQARQWPVLPAAASLIALGGLATVAITTRARDVHWLCAGALTMMAFSYFGALGGQINLLSIYFGGRYYYAPQVLVGLTLLGVARAGPAIAQIPAAALVGWLLLVGIHDYRHARSETAAGPSWRDQIAHWRTDPDAATVLWPSTFQIHLGHLPSP